MKTHTLKPTNDDWHPNYPGNLVKVSLTQTGPNPPINGDFRVCVWGRDDFGMERDFKDRTEAQEMYRTVTNLSFVDKLALKSLGFVQA